jgi:cytochrome P450
MKTVWDESTTQTAEMLDSFNRTAQKPHGPGGIIEGLKRITIDVIGYITFGTQQSWKEVDHTHAPEGFKTTFSSSVLTIVNNLFPVVFLPAKLLTLPFMPKAVRKIGTAKIEFPLHLRGKIIRERSSQSSTATLVTSLVKLAAQSHPTNVSKSSTFLSEEEIAGNLFAFTVAGFDTTANTLVYALLALAIWPEWQEWVFEEMGERDSDVSYEELFPRLVRCRALMVCVPKFE